MERKEKLGLIRRMIAAKGPQEITDIGFELFGNPLFLHGNDGSINFFTRAFYIEDESWQKDIVEGGMAKLMLRDIDNNEEELFERFMDSNQPEIAPSRNNDSGRSFVMPIFYQEQPIGNFILNELLFQTPEEELSELKDLLHLTGEIFQQKYADYMDRNSGRNNIEDGIFIRLLLGISVNPDIVNEHMKKIGWEPEKYLHIVLIQLRSLPMHGIEQLPDLVGQLMKNPKHLLIRYRGRLVYIFSGKEKRLEHDAEFVKLRDYLDECQMMMGVSHVFENVLAIHKYYDQAERALNIGAEISQMRAPVLDFDYLYPYLLIDAYSRQRDIDELLNEEIIFLAEYDRKNNTELVETLKYYLECNLDIMKTAERMYLHKNTIRYRIRRCEELLNTDFSDENEWFGFLLSFKAMEYKRYVHTEPYNQAPDSYRRR